MTGRCCQAGGQRLLRAGQALPKTQGRGVVSWQPVCLQSYMREGAGPAEATSAATLLSLALNFSRGLFLSIPITSQPGNL